jgi:tetratricopeptide (TPR) repeat protein
MCQQGRAQFGDDAELWFLESVILMELGRLTEAEACLRELLSGRRTFVCGDLGLCGYKARHNLGLLYARQQRWAEAEAEWRAVIAQQPKFVPAWRCLGGERLESGREMSYIKCS